MVRPPTTINSPNQQPRHDGKLQGKNSLSFIGKLDICFGFLTRVLDFTQYEKYQGFLDLPQT